MSESNWNDEDWAIHYANKGWEVVPLWWVNDDGTCGCGSIPCRSKPGKHPCFPVAPHGKDDSTTDLDTIRQWFRRFPNLNIGIHCAPSGLFVVDVDVAGAKIGAKSFQRMLEDHGDFVAGAGEAVSGSGGKHFFFKHPGGDIADKSNVPGYPNVDVKTDGYIIVCPSHNAAGAYKWLEEPYSSDALPLAPNWLVELLSESAQKEVHSYLHDDSKWDHTLPKEAEKACEGDLCLRSAIHVRLAPWLDDPTDQSAIDQSIASTLAVHDLDDPDIIRRAIKWSLENAGIARPKGDSYWDHTISTALSVPAPSIMATIPPTPTSIKILPFTDRANAERFKDIYEDSLLCDGKSWLEYSNEGLWVTGTRGKGLHYCDAVAARIASEMGYQQAKGAETKTIKAYKAAAEKMESTSVRRNCIDQAKELLSDESINYDANNYLLLCRDGVLDLTDADNVTTRSPEPGDYFKKQTDAYIKGARSSADIPVTYWEDRCAEWLPDRNIRDAFQMFCGLCLTGDISFQVFAFIYGPGGTGKSTAVKAILKTLGSYAATVAFNSFTEGMKKDAGAATPQVMRMKGKRLVSALEAPDNASFDSAFIKGMTGGERMVGRALYQEQIEFDVMAKALFVGNVLPRVAIHDDGFWRRVMVLEFNEVQTSAGHRNIDIAAELATQEVQNQILAWMVKGWSMLGAHRGNGFPVPQECSESMKEWQGDNDTLRQFVEECCELDPSYWESTDDLYRAYGMWFMGEEKFKLTDRGFGRKINRPGVAVNRKRVNGKVIRGRRGIRLKTGVKQMATY
jgi:putative DNA primase/helicase